MRLLVLFFLCPLLLLATEAQKEPVKKRPPPDHLMIAPGIFDVDQKRPCFLFQLEYRWDVNCCHLRPLAGTFFTTDQSLFVYGGLAWDIWLGKHGVFTPSFAPGIYFHGRGKNLGFPLEFRSAAELAWVFNNKGRLGAQFNHISNASLGYKNPGADSLIFFYAIPLPN